jgi:hypothetical protein
MTKARILQWPASVPLLKKSPFERAVETARQIAEAGQLLFVCSMQKSGHIKVWLENIKCQCPYRYPNTTPKNEQTSSWIISIYPTHPFYELLLADKPITFIEFLFSEELVDNWHLADPASYLTVKSVK